MEKNNNNPEHAQKNCKVLQVVRREGEFFTIPTVFALEGSIEKKIVLRWNDTPFSPIWDQIRENNGPNGQTAQCMTPSEFYKNRYIQRYWPATNWILCVYVAVVVRRFATGDVFVYLQ